jgi:hypothetical protein
MGTAELKCGKCQIVFVISEVFTGRSGLTFLIVKCPRCGITVAFPLLVGAKAKGVVVCEDSKRVN